MIHVAAVGDIHFAPDAAGTLRPHLEHLSERADLLCLAGDLTRVGTPEEARAKSDRLGGDRPGVVRGTPSDGAEQIAAYAAAGAAWVILGPVDSSDPSNATLLGEARRLVLSGQTDGLSRR